jgi:hypothetical protein
MLETTKPPNRILGRDFLGEQDSLQGVSSRRKTISLIETLTSWIFLSSFDSPAGDEGYGPKDEF